MTPTYDTAGRLTQVTSGVQPVLGYVYDAAGRITSLSQLLAEPATPTDPNTAVTATLRSWLAGYNANGDMTGDGLRSYTYDAEGRLNTATTGATDTSPTTRYAHNAMGQRVFKTEPLYPPAEGDENDAGFMQGLIDFFTHLWSPTTTTADGLGFGFVYDEQGTLIGEYGAGGAKSVGSKQYLYLPTAAGPMPIALIANSDTNYAVLSDHLNTPRRMTGSDGSLVWQWGYSAFGEEQPTVATRRFNKVAAMDGDLEMNLRYPGQYFDKESGLHYNGFRTYNPVTGRYTQGDPIGLAGGWNRFGYVGGNAISLSDPDGLNPMAGAAGGAATGSAFGPVGTVVGGIVGAGAGAAIGWHVIGPMLAKPGNESRPTDAPSGTIPIDQVGLGRGDVHDIKDGVQNGARDWTGIAPNGDVITSDPRGRAVNNGPADSFTRRPTGLCK